MIPKITIITTTATLMIFKTGPGTITLNATPIPAKIHIAKVIPPYINKYCYGFTKVISKFCV